MLIDKRHIILALAAVLCLFSCADDDERQITEPEVVEFCVQSAWSNGRDGGTRATLPSLLATDLATDKDLIIAPADYPTEIVLTCEAKEYILTRPTDALSPCAEHPGYYHGYTCSRPLLRDVFAKKGVTAHAFSLDGGEDLYSETNEIVLDGLHLKISMHHSKALVRFLFKLDENYDKIRYILVKNITFKKTLNGEKNYVPEIKEGGLVLNTTGYYCAGYCYIDPAAIADYRNVEITCIYDVYDKDAVFPTEGMTDSEKDAANTELAKHRTRQNVQARNTINLGSLKDAGGNYVSSIEAGYYYDLRVTLNPDYLYVLSDHDNKHLTIE